MENQHDISSPSSISSELIRSQVVWTEQSAYSFEVENWSTQYVESQILLADSKLS